MGKKMNLLQEDYGTRLSTIGNQSRLLVELFSLYHGPVTGYPKGVMIGAQLQTFKTNLQ